jgi:hypothetical protein
MFRKKIDTEVLNLFNTIENKIDTINTNFNCITFLEGCCRCKERDVKINEMLITFLESKFSELYINDNENTDKINSILQSVKTELENTKVNNKSSFELLTNSISNLTNETINLKTEMLEFKQNSTNESINLKNEILEELKQAPSSDKLLRSDLNTFLVAIKDDIKTDMKQNIQFVNHNIDLLKNTLSILINKTDAIFYDNEIIKHQFSIEENIKIYTDTIDSLKLSIEKSINDIDKLLV